jgi:hypothetical protein
MNIGDAVEFHITGMIPRYRGTVLIVAGKHGQPEIEVTDVWFQGEWVRDDSWPTLKDGDYILTT